MKKITISVVFILAVAFGAWYALPTSGQDAGPTGGLKTATVSAGDLRLTVAATGTVTPETIVTVKSKAGGEIISLPYEEGDRIEKDAVAVRLDPTTEETRVKQSEASLLMARARLEKAKVALKDAKVKLKRARNLHREKILSDQELEDAEIAVELAASDVRIADAEVTQAEEKLKEARVLLDDTVVKAPLTGTILKKFVDEGQIISSTLSSVTEGTDLFNMANLDRLFVTAQIDEVDIAGVGAGLHAEVRVDSLPGRLFDARVIRVSPLGRVERTVTVFDVFMEIGGDTTGLRPGMTADIEVLKNTLSGVLLVPNEALRVKDGSTGVYVVPGAGAEPKWTEVEAGATDGLRTVALRGLAPGDTVLISAPEKNSGTKNNSGIFRIFRRRK